MFDHEEDILRKITDCEGQLYEVILENEDLNMVVLNFFVSLELCVKIRVDKPMLFSFSRFPDVLGTYIIMEAFIREVSRYDYDTLNRLNYSLLKDGRPFLDREKATWLHIEGDVNIDILCEKIVMTELRNTGEPKLGI